jgi:hypothetical protein
MVQLMVSSTAFIMKTAARIKKNLIKFKKRALKKLPHPTSPDNLSQSKARVEMSNKSLY